MRVRGYTRMQGWTLARAMQAKDTLPQATDGGEAATGGGGRGMSGVQ